MKAKTLPDFKTAGEEAEFWEKHSMAPYWGQMEPVEFKMTRARKPVSIRFDPIILAKVRALARQKGVPYQTLVQMLVAEKVRESMP
jgi:predicted DNA binding CopG/RHH family protein